MTSRETLYLPQRGLDHIVAAVGNLETAAMAWERLGFTLTGRGVHPWGTANRLVQLHGFFIEILEVADSAKLIAPTPRQFSFGAYLAAYLKQREGIAMTVFESQDAHADRDLFAERGLPDLEPFHFQRTAELPNGDNATVAFSLAFAPPEESPDAVFFTCQHHAPEYFWKPDYQRHANTAQAVDEVTMVADDPPAYAATLGHLQTSQAVTTSQETVLCETLRGRIRVVTPHAYHDWTGLTPMPDAPPGPHFAAIRLVVSDLGKAQGLIDEADFESHWGSAGLVMSGAQLHGCSLAFAQG